MASHPKHAKLAPRLDKERAVAETIDARAELLAATSHERRCQLIEADLLSNFIALRPPPSAEQTWREMVRKENEAKLERIASGLPAIAPKTPTHNGSAIDCALANRPRNNRTGRPATAGFRPPVFKR
jgi:hypothetical protein